MQKASKLRQSNARKFLIFVEPQLRGHWKHSKSLEGKKVGNQDLFDDQHLLLEKSRPEELINVGLRRSEMI